MAANPGPQPAPGSPVDGPAEPAPLPPPDREDTPVTLPYFDHVAIALARWSLGYPALITQLGGEWLRGTTLATFSPGQLGFADGMIVELLAPGHEGDDFVARFLSRRGAGPHHLNFKVADLDEFAAACARLGYELMPPHFVHPQHRETFLHPSGSGLGTLLQVVQWNRLHYLRNAPAEALPESRVTARRVDWVALVVSEPARSTELFTTVLGGRVVANSPPGRPWWSLIEWVPGRRLLLLSSADPAGGSDPRPLGIHHIQFGDPSSPVARPPATGRRMAQSDALGIELFETPLA